MENTNNTAPTVYITSRESASDGRVRILGAYLSIEEARRAAWEADREEREEELGKAAASWLDSPDYNRIWVRAWRADECVSEKRVPRSYGRESLRLMRNSDREGEREQGKRLERETRKAAEWGQRYGA